jgi:hypothetical protein
MSKILRIDLGASSQKAPEVQTARVGVGTMVWGREDVVARLGGPAVIVRGGSWRVCR